MLRVRDLTVSFDTPDGTVRAVSGLDLDIARGDTLGIVGESGAGKSQAMLALMGLLARNGRAGGSARFDGVELIGLAPRALNRIRGSRITMVFQDPMTCLNPYLKVGTQMTEVLVRHRGVGHDAALRRAVELLDAVRIPDAAERVRLYPHEFSGGMRQRVMIAMALLCDPDLLIADEPTTALDVTVQAQTLALLRDLQRDFGTAIIMITHDLGVVAGLCERVMVMYAGRCVETAEVDALYRAPQHPYTAGLLRSVPRLDTPTESRLATIAGDPPDLQALPRGCPYSDRCESVFARCHIERPELRVAGAAHTKACHLDGPPA